MLRTHPVGGAAHERAFAPLLAPAAVPAGPVAPIESRGPAMGSSMNVGIPPRSRNHRLPAAWDAPTANAAPSLLEPFAISCQNNRSTSRRSDGFPGDFIGALPVNSVIHPAGLPINTSTIKVLRRPVESSEHEPSEMTLWQPIPHIRSQQKRLLTINSNEVLGHHQMVLNPPDDPRFTRQPPSCAGAQTASGNTLASTRYGMATCAI
jgi:hypothetical protein